MPASNWDTKSRFSAAPSGSCPFLAPVSENDQSCVTKKETQLFCLFSKQNQLLLNLYYTPICIKSFFFFSFWFYCLYFYVSYKRVLSVNSNYPPFLSLNQSFGYRTSFSSPSKQLWLWCWPRFTILLKQYVVLCLGFLGMVYECTHSSVIVYPPKSACQFVINVKKQAVWGLLNSQCKHTPLNLMLELCDLCLMIIVRLV